MQRDSKTCLVGADDADREALLAGQQQRLVHLVKGLVEGLDLAHALITRQVASAAASVQEPLPLVPVVLVPATACPLRMRSKPFTLLIFKNGLQDSISHVTLSRKLELFCNAGD